MVIRLLIIHLLYVLVQRALKDEVKTNVCIYIANDSQKGHYVSS